MYIIGDKLKELSSIDGNKSLEVKVRFGDTPAELDAQLPFFTPQGETIFAPRPKEIEVRVRAYSRTLFGTLLTVPPLDEALTYRLRG